jgi:hypothetical protein
VSNRGDHPDDEESTELVKTAVEACDDGSGNFQNNDHKQNVVNRLQHSIGKNGHVVTKRITVNIVAPSATMKSRIVSTTWKRSSVISSIRGESIDASSVFLVFFVVMVSSLSR